MRYIYCFKYISFTVPSTLHLLYIYCLKYVTFTVLSTWCLLFLVRYNTVILPLCLLFLVRYNTVILPLCNCHLHGTLPLYFRHLQVILLLYYGYIIVMCTLRNRDLYVTCVSFDQYLKSRIEIWISNIQIFVFLFVNTHSRSILAGFVYSRQQAKGPTIQIFDLIIRLWIRLGAFLLEFFSKKKKGPTIQIFVF